MEAGIGSDMLIIGDANVVALANNIPGAVETNTCTYSTAEGATLVGISKPLAEITNDLVYTLDAPNWEQKPKVVVLYAGSSYTTSSMTDYLTLVNTLHTCFPEAQIKCHLLSCSSSSDKSVAKNVEEYNKYIKTITNVEVINNFDSTWTDSNFMFNSDITETSGELKPDYLYSWYASILNNNCVNRNAPALAFVIDQSASTKVKVEGCTIVNNEAEDKAEADVNIGAFFPKVTVLHSVNAALSSSGENVYFIPEYSNFPMDLESVVESGKYDNSSMYHGFAACYSKEFDLEAHNQMPLQKSKDTSESVYYNTSLPVFKNGTASRELETLGYDFQLSSEKCTYSKKESSVYANYKAKKLDLDDSINLNTAIMDTYKALGTECFDTQFSFLPDSQLQPETSPLQEDISLLLGNKNGVNWDNSEGACWVFATRTNPDLYCEKASKEGLIGTIKKNNPSFEPTKWKDKLTVGEFCILLKEMLQLYGEPTLTEQEQQLLLQVYGKNLPIYLDGTEEFDAIKYLAAKGIINLENSDKYEWSSDLTLEIMLSMLMSAKDKDSRATFKDIQLTMDVNLANKGYFPTTVSSNMSNIQSLMYMDTSSTADYFDYLIPTSWVKEGTYDSFIAEGVVSNDINTPIYTGILYTTTGKSYVWLSIPIERDTTGSLVKKDITITNGFESFVVKNTGGYLYKNDKKEIKQHSFNENSSGYKFPKGLIDAKKYKKAVNAINADGDINTDDFEDGFTYLSKDNNTVVVFSLPKSSWKKEITKIKFAEKALKADLKQTVKKGDKQYIIEAFTPKSSDKLMMFKVQGCKNYKEFQDLFKTSSSYYKEYNAFQKNADTILVSTDCLKDMGLLVSSAEILDGSVLQLTSDTNTIYLSKTYGYVLNGNSIYQVPDSSELWYKGDSGDELYIDYRAVLGWGSPCITFSNANTSGVTLNYFGNYKANMTESIRIKNVQSAFAYAKSNLTVDGHTAGDGSKYIMLNSIYELSNYLVFYGNEEKSATGTTNDVLFVFKPKVTSAGGEDIAEPKTEISSKYLKDYLGLSLQDADKMYIYAYPLERAFKSGGGNHNPPGVVYQDAYGYLYKANTNVSGNIYKKYYKSPEKKGVDKTNNFVGWRKLKDGGKYWNSKYLVLPFVQAASGDVYNINCNTFSIGNKNISYGYFPTKLVNGIKSSAQTLTYYNPADSSDYVKELTDKTYSNIDDAVQNPAALGIGANFLKLPTKDWTTAGSPNNIVYYGTMCTQLDGDDLKIGPYTIANKKDDSSMKFTVLKETSTYLAVGCNASFVQAFDTPVSTDEDPGISIDITLGESLQKVDWENFNLQTALENLDDWLTIGTFAVLAFFPRFAITLFIVLIALSLVANIKVVQVFCDKVFDFYKILTLGRLDVHTINTQTLLISSIIGVGIFWLFLDGTIIDILSWVVRAVVGISTR